MHIQVNTTRTHYSTVVDCLHRIHWLQASQKELGHKKLSYAHWIGPIKADVKKRVPVPGGVAKLGDEVDKQGRSL